MQQYPLLALEALAVPLFDNFVAEGAGRVYSFFFLELRLSLITRKESQIEMANIL